MIHSHISVSLIIIHSYINELPQNMVFFYEISLIYRQKQDFSKKIKKSIEFLSEMWKINYFIINWRFIYIFLVFFFFLRFLCFLNFYLFVFLLLYFAYIANIAFLLMQVLKLLLLLFYGDLCSEICGFCVF